MKPLVILPPGVMSPEDIKKLESNDLCVVTCKDPSQFRFVDPIPTQSSRTKIEDAAIKLSRVVLNGQWGHITTANYLTLSDAARMYLQILMEGTPLDRRGTVEERCDLAYDDEKIQESRRLARVDAKAEREAKKAKLIADAKSSKPA